MQEYGLLHFHDATTIRFAEMAAAVSNAGGLDPAGCAAAIAEFAPEGTRIAVVTGDNLTTEIPRLREAGEGFVNLDTGEAFDDVPWVPLTANAYLGSAGVAHAVTSR